jgi:hypothetical protein
VNNRTTGELLTLHLPGEYLARMERYARNWHESRLPHSMRERGVTGLRYRRVGRTGFELLAHGISRQRLVANAAVCRGTIEMRAGGSVVRFSVGLPRSRWAAPVIVGILVTSVFAIAGAGLFAALAGAWFLGGGTLFNIMILPGTCAVFEPEFTEILTRIGHET